MGIDRLEAQSHEVVNKHVEVAIAYGSYQLTPQDQVVRALAGTAANVDIVLPPVVEAKGRIFSIVVRTAGTGTTVTVKDKDDSEGWTDLVHNADGEKTVLYSDGYCWHVLATSVS